MLENCYGELKRNQNVRENLSLLRGAVKDTDGKQRLLALVGDGTFLLGLLGSEEAKVRKNAALLIGDLGLVGAKEALFDAYNQEGTLFVRSAYLTALKKMDASAYLAAFSGAPERAHRAGARGEREKARR